MNNNPHLKKQVIEALEQCILSSEEIWTEVRKMLEREGIPPPPVEQRRATEMEMVIDLHVRLKEQSRSRMVPPLTNYTVNEDTPGAIARHLESQRVQYVGRPNKRLKPSQVRHGPLPRPSSSSMVE